MPDARTSISGLSVATVLYDFVNQEALPGTGLEQEAFWAGFAKLLKHFATTNAVLLGKRDEIQKKLDGWYRAQKGKPHDQGAYEAYLREIGYLLPEPAAFSVETLSLIHI